MLFSQSTVSLGSLVNFSVGGSGGVPESECCPGSIQEPVIVGNRFQVVWM